MWNDAKVEALRNMWADGVSAEVIAIRLKCASRSAVIGKVHRLALASRPTRLAINMKPARRKRLKPKPRPRIVFAPVLPAEPWTPPADDVAIPPAERKTLQMLGDKDCRWPIGDPGGEDPHFGFCGRPKKQGSPIPYCEHHLARATGQPQVRRPAPPVEQEEAA